MDTSDLQTTTEVAFGPKLAQLRQNGLAAAAAGAVLAIVGAATSGPEGAAVFFQGYHWAYLFWLGATLGCLGLLLLHHTVGGGWGMALRRFLESGVKNIPLMALLFIPVILSLYFANSPVFPWGRDHLDAVTAYKAKYYLKPAFFIIRWVVFFGIWYWWAQALLTMGKTQDERADPVIYDRLNNFAARCLPIFVLIDTFVIVDLAMSLTPRWLSSIMGLLVVVSQGLTGIALMLMLMGWIGGQTRLLRTAPSGVFRDLGNFMLAFLMLWAYMSLSQYLIQYAGNTGEEISWYITRRHGLWGMYSLLLIPLHFALPFLILLVGSPIKKDPRKLAGIAAFIFVMRIMDVCWWVTPTFHPDITFGMWMLADLGAFLFIGGCWLTVWAGHMARAGTVIVLHDPRVQEVLGSELAAHHG